MKVSPNLIMASSGFTLPTTKYVNSISSHFPTPSRSYKVESGLKNRYLRDYLPINASLSNGSVEDNYIEFIINSNNQEFIDTSSFAMEMKMKITKSDDSPIDGTKKISVIDGLGHRILSRCTLCLNGVPVESNSYFGLYNALKTYTSMPKHKMVNVGRNMFYKDISIPIEDIFTNENLKNEEDLVGDTSLHFVTPLHLDISTSDFHLLNSVEMRLRFDLCPPSVLINSAEAENFKYTLQNVKIWVQKVISQDEALLSLNQSLLSSNNTIEYIVDRPIIKNFVFPAGQSILSIDNIFNSLIPHTLYVFAIKQRSINGAYNQNAAYFTHCNMSSIRMELNGNTISSLTCNFPNQIANVFHNSLFHIKNDDNLLTLQNFKQGRTIYIWDLTSSDCSDDLKIEKSGNLRLSIQLAKPNKENIIIYVVGITSGVVEVDASRRIKTSYLM